MQDVPKPWPSPEDLEELVKQSEGLFIYVSTLVGFVGDGNGLPQEKLKVVMRVHEGVDPLYGQVLSEAQKFENFERVIGAIIYLRQPLPVSELGQLLQLQPGRLRLALRGCQSVFTISSNDVSSVRPYHASLRDFLTDRTRAKGHYLDLTKHHAFILVDCIWSITTSLEKSAGDAGQFDYPYQNWCYHLSLAFSQPEAIGFMEPHLEEVVTFMRKMEKQWLQLWICRVEGFDAIKSVCADLDSALTRMPVSLVFKVHESLMTNIG